VLLNLAPGVDASAQPIPIRRSQN